jgi:beta-N-acetylhexosaminidase
LSTWNRTRAVTAAVALAVCATIGVTACSPPRAAPKPSPSGPRAIPVPAPTTPEADSCIAQTISAMTLRQQVGQVMLVGTPIANPANLASLITSYGFGGVFLSGRTQAPAASIKAGISALQAAAPKGAGLLIALDQEGGRVQTLQGLDFPSIPSAVEQGALSDQALRSQTEAWASLLSDLGVTLDLAPVADTVPTSLGAGNPPIGALNREYGSDPAAVATDVATVVAALQNNGVYATLKHFPGLGRVTQNTDFSTGAIDAQATTSDEYLEPFRAGIKAGAGAVMVSLAYYPNLDPAAIAAFSAPIVTALLRQRLGFAGVIVSDDLGSAVAVRDVPVGQRAVDFINAGGDLALTVAPSTAAPMFDGLLAAANASAELRAKVTAAATRVVRAKYAIGLLPCSPPR